MDEENWAAAHYRVERSSRGLSLSRRKRRRALAAGLGGAISDGEPSDLVRIYDRAGRVVFERAWEADRAGASAQEARIVDDLLKLDVVAFRFRYDIEDPALRAVPPADPAPDDPDDHAPPAGHAGAP